MSVDSVINEFINEIRSNYNLSIFDIVVPDSNEGNVIDYFDPKTILEVVCQTLESLKSTINNAFLCLFNDLEQINGEHQNFISLNTLSEMFRNTPSYSLETKQFTDKLEYAYTCGELYSSYSKSYNGDFINTLYKNIPINITKICNKYQQLYNEFNSSTNIKYISKIINNEESIPKITQFWNKYNEQFTEEILQNKNPFIELQSNFNEFYTKIIEYKDLGTRAAKLQATGFVFINATNREQQVLSNMNDIFKLCRNKFKNYDELVDELYELWLTTIEHVNKNYLNLSEYDIESMKQKIYSGLLLEKINFFSDSEILYNYFLTFFSQYNIK